MSVALLAACGAVLKPPEPDRRLNVSVNGQLFESDRGYRFAVLPDDGANVIRVDVRYPVGSIDDPAGKEGLAHLVEHLLFDVEIDRENGKTSIGAELGRVALSSNAETHSDYTVYQLLAPPEALDEIMRLETERLATGCKGLTPEIFAREREVVRNELRQRQGTRGAAIEQAVVDAVFPANHPYRRVDSIDSVAKLELDDACKFLAGPYQRGKAMIAISGAISVPALQAAAAKHMGKLHKRMMIERPAVPAVSPQPGVVKIKADVDEPTLIATWPLPPTDSRDGQLLRLVSHAIARPLEGAGFEFKWGHSASTVELGGPQAPVLAVEIELDAADKAEEAMSFVPKAVHRVKSSLGLDRESPAWRSRWQGAAEGLLARWESLGGRVEMFGDFLEFDPQGGQLVGRIEQLSKASPEAVRDLADKWLSADRARFVLLEPSGAPTARAAGGYAGHGGEERGSTVDGTLADHAVPVPAIWPLKTIRYKLDNGLSVILWPNGSAPLVHGRLVIDSGSAQEPKGKGGIARLVGAQEVDPDNLVFEERRLAPQVDELVYELSLELRSPGYGLTDEEKEYLHQRLTPKWVDEATSYERGFAAALYGFDHPYAHGFLTPETLEGMHHDLVMSWARDHLVPKNATLVVAGHFDAELVKKHIAYDLDQVAAGSHAPPAPPMDSPDGQLVRGIETRPSATVQLDVGFVAGEGVDVNYAKRLVLEQILDSKLSRLRGKDAVTYGFSASYSPRRVRGMWQIGGAADANRAAEATRALLDVLDEMRRDPESYRAEFVMARQKVLQDFVVTTSSSSAVVEQLTLLARFDLPDNYFTAVAAQVARLTLADMKPFVKGELAVDAQVVGAFGNADAVDAALAVAGRH